MAGITSMGIYIPMYRLKREEIARMWGAHAIGGEKAVAGYDEDPVTMAVAATRECLKNDTLAPECLFFASTTAPYHEKQSAAIIANSVGLDKKSITADFANSLKSGTTAIKSALDAVNAGSAERVLVAAADCRLGLPKGRFEQLFGDAAAAFTIGNEGVIAQIESFSSLYSEFTGLWRTGSDRFVKSGEARFIDTEGYLPLMQEIISGLMETHNIKPGDFSKIILPAFDARQHTVLANKLGFESSQIQDPMFARIGHTGTVATLIMLIAALEQAHPGDRILLTNYGDGADAMIIRVTEAITKVQTRKRLADRLEKSRSIDYGAYLSWRDLIQLEKPSLPPRGEPSLSARWRERHVIATLSGVKCRQCGLPQIHTIGQKIRICVGCQSKDDFESYSFSDKKAALFTYAVDHLQPTKNPPGLNGTVDFEGGGRLICELTDCDPDQVEIGMPLEMTFRKMFQSKGIINYFWKAKPVG